MTSITKRNNATPRAAKDMGDSNMSNKSNISGNSSGGDPREEGSGHEVGIVSFSKGGFNGRFRCSRCRGTHFWIGVTGARICVFCLPPKSPDAVAKWVDRGEK